MRILATSGTRACAVLVALWVLAAPLAASPAKRAQVLDSTSADRTAVAVTVYNDGRGLVREERRVRLADGVTELRFMDVAEKVEAPTVKVGVLSGGAASVLEQNYEFDLLSPQKLLEKFVGQDVTLVQQRLHDGSTEDVETVGRLLSTNAGTVWQIGGRIVTNPPVSRMVFPNVPENLIARPTLVWLVDAEGSAERRIEATYLTGGMSWHADYVLGLDDAEAQASLQGWVTVDNQSGAGYEDARLKLVAGDVHRAPAAPQPAVLGMAKARAVGEAVQQEALFEYHLYSLPRPTTLKNNQTKQVQLLDAPRVKVGKEYVLSAASYWYRGPWAPADPKQKVQVFLTLRNDVASGLGQPLPKGIVRVYKRDRSGSPQFVGEDRVDHTPRDETVRLELGNAFDVVAERRQTDFARIADSVFETAHEIRIRNHKDEAVTVHVVEPIGGDWTMLSHSLPFEKSAAFEAGFDVPVAAGAESVLAYRVRVKY